VDSGIKAVLISPIIEGTLVAPDFSECQAKGNRTLLFPNAFRLSFDGNMYSSDAGSKLSNGDRTRETTQPGFLYYMSSLSQDFISVHLRNKAGTIINLKFGISEDGQHLLPVSFEASSFGDSSCNISE
jgi:hypothetical protein